MIKKEALVNAKQMEREKMTNVDDDQYARIFKEIIKVLLKSFENFKSVKIEEPKPFITKKYYRELIKEGETVLIYGKYAPFREIIRKAAEDTKFKLVFVDSFKDASCKRLNSQERSRIPKGTRN